MINPEFEVMAKRKGLDLSTGAYGYTNPRTQEAFEFWSARQPEIDQLKHDYANMDCAARLLGELVKQLQQG